MVVRIFTRPAALPTLPLELISINASVMLSGAKHLRSISVRRIGSKINPRFFASLRMTLFDGLPCANHEFDQSQRRTSKHQDKDAGDHQREHPDEIDVEPRAAQYRDPKFFVNHDRDQRGG